MLVLAKSFFQNSSTVLISSAYMLFILAASTSPVHAERYIALKKQTKGQYTLSAMNNGKLCAQKRIRVRNDHAYIRIAPKGKGFKAQPIGFSAKGNGASYLFAEAGKKGINVVSVNFNPRTNKITSKKVEALSYSKLGKNVKINSIDLTPTKKGRWVGITYKGDKNGKLYQGYGRLYGNLEKGSFSVTRRQKGATTYDSAGWLNLK